MWSATLLQQNPNAVTPKLQMGDVIIKEGTTFKLTIPTHFQDGNVFMDGEVTSPPNPPQLISAFVAQWPLSSFLAAQNFLVKLTEEP